MRRVPAGRSRASDFGALLVAAALALPAAAQTPTTGVRVEVAVEPRRVTVGDPFHSAVRIAVPRGYRVSYPDFDTSDTLQAIAPVALTDPTDGTSAAVYSLVAWVAGVPLQAEIPVTIVAADGGTRVERVRLRLPEVASVLPAPPESVEPRPPRGVMESEPVNRLPWWWWLALLLGAVMAVGIAYWLAKRRVEEEAVEIDPRAWALAQLGSRTAAALEARELAALYRHVAWVLRGYLYRIDAGLGPDLTTTELLARLHAHGALGPGAVELGDLLRGADRVKFARYLPSMDEAGRFLSAAREWVALHPAPEPAEEPRRAA